MGFRLHAVDTVEENYWSVCGDIPHDGVVTSRLSLSSVSPLILPALDAALCLVGSALHMFASIAISYNVLYL